MEGARRTSAWATGRARAGPVESRGGGVGRLRASRRGQHTYGVSQRSTARSRGVGRRPNLSEVTRSCQRGLGHGTTKREASRAYRCANLLRSTRTGAVLRGRQRGHDAWSASGASDSGCGGSRRRLSLLGPARRVSDLTLADGVRVSRAYVAHADGVRVFGVSLTRAVSEPVADVGDGPRRQERRGGSTQLHRDVR